MIPDKDGCRLWDREEGNPLAEGPKISPKDQGIPAGPAGDPLPMKSPSPGREAPRGAAEGGAKGDFIGSGSPVGPAGIPWSFGEMVGPSARGFPSGWGGVGWPPGGA